MTNDRPAAEAGGRSDGAVPTRAALPGLYRSCGGRWSCDSRLLLCHAPSPLSVTTSEWCHQFRHPLPLPASWFYWPDDGGAESSQFLQWFLQLPSSLCQTGATVGACHSTGAEDCVGRLHCEAGPDWSSGTCAASKTAPGIPPASISPPVHHIIQLASDLPQVRLRGPSSARLKFAPACTRSRSSHAARPGACTSPSVVTAGKNPQHRAQTASNGRRLRQIWALMGGSLFVAG